MSFDYFKLKNIKELVTASTKLQPESPERRKFIKTMGFGIIAANPVIKTVGSLSGESFDIEHQGNYFAIKRNGQILWEISKTYFGENYSLKVDQTTSEIIINARNLQIIQTNFKFDLEAVLSNKKSSKWQLHFIIPQFNIDQKIDFINWVDGLNTIQAVISLNQNLISLNNKDTVFVKGNFDCQISPKWEFSLENKEGILADINDTTYLSDKLLITPTQEEFNSILSSKLTSSARIILEGNNNWHQLINTLNKANDYIISIANDTPNFNISLGTTDKGKIITSVWVAQNQGNLSYSEKQNPTSVLEFSNYFYLSNYSGNAKPEFFLTAKMKDTEQWVTNSIGSFQVARDKKDAELEIYGQGLHVKEHKLLPKLITFTPTVKGAISLPTSINDDSLLIPTSISSAKHNKKIKAVKKNQASLQIKAEGLEYAPKKPIKIKVVRPEDMVYLEFEFYNFKFIGDKGSSHGKLGGKGKIDGKGKSDGKIITIPHKKNTEIQPIYKGIKPTKKLKASKGFGGIKKGSTKKISSIHKTENSIAVRKTDISTMINGVFNDTYFAGLKLDNPNKKGIVIIYFPSQHTLEQAFSKGITPSLPVKHIRAKKSRLVYELPAKHKGFDLSMNELLDWSKYKLVVDPRAWIKLDVAKVKNPTFDFMKTGIKTPKNVKHLSKNEKDFAVKMVLANKKVDQKNKMYETQQLNKVLYNSTITTLKPTYSIIKNLNFTPVMGPVNKMHTSIEAPALLYISPNQTNDFLHKKGLAEEVKTKKTSTKKIEKVTFKNRFEKYSLKPNVLNFINLSDGKGTITELWHTQLGVKMKDGSTTLNLEKLRTIRALWAFEADKKPEKIDNKKNKPFIASLDASDRHKLVHLTSNYGIRNYKPEPVKVKKLLLSNLGAYIDWHVNFKTPDSMPSLDILEWQHQATLGRDNYVKIVKEGYLFPFGHKAVKVSITERKFNATTKAAVNEKREYIIVLEESVTYQRNDASGKFIKFPFQEIIIKDKKTSDTYSEESLSENSFIIKGFNFNIEAIDKEGQKHILGMPLAFVSKVEGLRKSKITNVINNYHKNVYKRYTDIPLYGQKIAYSESILDGDTTLETNSLQFGAMVYPTSKNTAIKFHPIMRESEVFIEAVDKMSSTRKPSRINLEDDKNDGSIFASIINDVEGAVDTAVNFAEDSRNSGGFVTPNVVINSLSKVEGAVTSKIEDVTNGIFKVLSVLDPVMDFPLPKIFGTISLASLIAEQLGASDLAESINSIKSYVIKIKEIQRKINEFKEKILFFENEAIQAVHDVRNSLEAEIRGLVDDVNSEIDAEIERIENEIETRVNEINTQVNTEIDSVKSQITAKVAELVAAVKDRIPAVPNLKTYFTEEAFYAEYKWNPKFSDKNITIIDGLLAFECVNPKSTLSIATLVEKPFTLDATANMSTVAKMNDFSIDLIPILKVNFKSMKFTTGSNTKTDVKVAMDMSNPIEFKGALTFVNNLQDLIPSGGFGEDGPYINILPSGVTAGYNLSLPDVEIGVCSITNMSLGAYVELPFSSAPLTMGFNFCTRENPFMLTISGFGGGGFFKMITTLDGIQTIEAAFEFGASMSLNVGVASGSVTVMGGFYFNMTMDVVDGNEVSTVVLSGYLRMNGKLSVLGLIHVSVEFYLALDAVMETVAGKTKVAKMVGSATLKVKVEVLFFSKTVSITVQREINGADADPKFIEMVDADDWQQYCIAFAS